MNGPPAHFRRVSVLVLAAATMVPLADPSPAAPRSEPRLSTMKSPLLLAEGRSSQIGLGLELDGLAYEKLKILDHVTFTDFALDGKQQADLDLTRVEIFAPDAQIVLGTPEGDVPLHRPDVVLLSGHVVGSPDSLAFLSLSPHGNNGLIRIEHTTFIVSTPPTDRGAGTTIYDWASLPPDAIKWRPWRCGTDELPQRHRARVPQADSNDANTSRPATSARSRTRHAQVAIETDWEFTADLFGGDMDASGAYAATLIGAVSEIYTRDLDTQLEIGFIRLWSTSDDPWDGDDMFEQYFQFQDYWNTYMTHVDRHAVLYLSGRGLGGGLGWLSGLCNEGVDYALSSGLNGYFPYPLEDNNSQNWDVIVVAHEFGHVFGAPHTHELDPPVDTCGWGCGEPTDGTLMSYCHACPGGISNILLRFHERIIYESIFPFLNYEVACDLGVPPPICEIVDPPSLDVHVSSSRHLSFTGGNPDHYTAVRVVLDDLPPPYDVLNGQVLWVGPPLLEFCENAGQALPPEAGCASAPGLDSRTYRAAVLRCEPHYRYRRSTDPVHVFGEVIVPGGTYRIQAIERACAPDVEENYSVPFPAVTSGWGDVVGNCAASPCTPPDGVVNVTTDVTATLDKYRNLRGAPRKARCDLEPALPDHLINIADVTYGVDAFRGFDYPFGDVPTPCP